MKLTATGKWSLLTLSSLLFLHTLLLDVFSFNPTTVIVEVISFNVILTTMSTRPELLKRQLASLGPQLTSADFISLLSDTDPTRVDLINVSKGALDALQCNGCTKIFRQNDPPLGGYGHASRTNHQTSLPGAFHMHGDDDDLYTPDAFDIIRSVVTSLEHRVYIFRVAKENFY